MYNYKKNILQHYLNPLFNFSRIYLLAQNNKYGVGVGVGEINMIYRCI